MARTTLFSSLIFNLLFWGQYASAVRLPEIMAKNRMLSARQLGNATRSSSCSPQPPEIKAPRNNSWGQLTGPETASVIQWLVARPELNIMTPSANANSSWVNTVILIETMMPNKTAVLPYVDGTGKEPPRYARVVLSNRTTTQPYHQELLVGPLPLDNATASWQPLEYTATRKNQGKTRDLAADEPSHYADWLYPLSRGIMDITLDLWNATCMGQANDTILPVGINPLWQDEDGSVHRWDMYFRIPAGGFDTQTLLPLGLFVKSNITGRDPSRWRVEGWFYNGVFYPTTEAFRAAHRRPGFVKLPAGAEGAWAWTDRQGAPFARDETAPPRAVAGGPPRFAVDTAQKYVEWMDFSFYLGYTRDTGLALFDVRYRGERILYEVSMQEALAHYAGNDPLLSSLAFLDSYYGFGAHSFELVKGYDCPEYASYLNATTYANETTHTHSDNICLFEFDADYPIQRHTTGQYVTVAKNVQFVVRTAATLGNYDYQFSYTFALDGTIKVDVRASGYIESAFAALNDAYGFQIHDALNGAMHDHVITFKLDLDVLGTANSLQLVSNAPVARTYPWSGNRTVNTMELQRRFVATEDEGRFNWDGNGRTQVLVVNRDHPNRYGEYRGWRVAPHTPAAHLTVVNSSNLHEAARFAEQDVAVTRAHDTEPRCANAYASQDTRRPPVAFADFFDGESLDQEDLVLWVGLGMHHVPHTGDLPNTVMTAAHAGIQLIPTNFFDGDQSVRSRSRARLNYDEGKVVDLVTGGVRAPVCEAALLAYHGDNVVRKYPYDPNNPYWQTGSVL